MSDVNMAYVGKNRFNELYFAYKKAHPTLKPFQAQQKAQELYTSAKDKFGENKEELDAYVTKTINEFECKASQHKAAKILNFFGKVPEKAKQQCESTTKANIDNPDSVPSCSSTNTVQEVVLKEVEDGSPIKSGVRKRHAVPVISDDEEDKSDGKLTRREYDTPAQNAARNRIVLLESQLNAAILARDTGLGGSDAQKNVESLKKALTKEKKSLKAAIENADRQKQFRKARKLAYGKLVAVNKDAPKVLKVQDAPGRPRRSDEMELIRVICEIAKFGGMADGRRRSDIIRTCKTLDDLHAALQEEGFQISRSGTYLRLLPRRADSIEGKRHIVTAPVKLCRAQADYHKEHSDQKFCVATIRSLETLASILGSSQVIFLSQDDKARVPIGMTAANKQAPFLMHLEYRVRLPDHDWVVAARHKLIPSVYAGIVIDDVRMGHPEAVGYSGPTYVAVRSGKHSSSTAETHAKDLERLLSVPCFEEIVKVNGVTKPVLIVSVDGGPDENPRYPKVIENAIRTFRKLNLDAMYICTNAPGLSAYNRVERRMSELSKELSGLIIPHDHFGSHLNESGITIDDELEVKNFEFAGKVLAETWTGNTYNGFLCVAEYIPSNEESSRDAEIPTAAWYSVHVRESQYFLQIVKCDDQQCCSPLRSNLKNVLPDGFFTAPFPLRRTHYGLEVVKPEDLTKGNSFAPFLIRQTVGQSLQRQNDIGPLQYDRYCPSVQSQIEDRTCRTCGLYFASKKNQKTHTKDMHGRAAKTKKVQPKRVIAERQCEVLCLLEYDNGEKDVEWAEKDDVEEEEGNVDQAGDTRPSCLIGHVESWLESPWTAAEQKR